MYMADGPQVAKQALKQALAVKWSVMRQLPALALLWPVSEGPCSTRALRMSPARLHLVFEAVFVQQWLSSAPSALRSFGPQTVSVHQAEETITDTVRAVLQRWGIAWWSTAWRATMPASTPTARRAPAKPSPCWAI